MKLEEWKHALAVVAVHMRNRDFARMLRDFVYNLNGCTCNTTQKNKKYMVIKEKGRICLSEGRPFPRLPR